MNVLLYLLVPVLVAALVIGLNVWRQRRPRSIEASVQEFRDGLDALDPAKSPARSSTKVNPKGPVKQNGHRPRDGRSFDGRPSDRQSDRQSDRHRP